MRQNISSSSPWEAVMGYSRAVRVGNIIEVAGTTAVDNYPIAGLGNAYEQTRFIFQKITKVLLEAGAKLDDVVRTRMYVKDIVDSEAVGKAHFEYFEHIKPVATMVEGKSLIHPDILVEIEVTAILNDSYKP